MAGVRSMLTRVSRLEVADGPVQSPIERTYGSAEGFCNMARARRGSPAGGHSALAHRPSVEAVAVTEHLNPIQELQCS